MQRRSFLQLSAFAAMSIGAAGLNGCATDEGSAAMSKPKFIFQFVEEESIKKAGEDYIKKFPNENKRNAIIRSLMEGMEVDASNTAAVEAALDKKIQDDFDKGSTVVVNGWILALTEARQCALFSLS